MAAQADITGAGAFNGAHQTQIRVLFAVAIVLTLAQWGGFLPAWLHRVPEFLLPPLELILDTTFNFIKEDLGLIYATRFLTEGLQWVLDVTANLLFGKRRWPNIGPVPWTAIAAVAGIVGYYLGGWRLAFLALGTFVWTALIGQWKLAMETMSVLVVAAPLAFTIGLLLGIAAWKNKAVDFHLSVASGYLFQSRSYSRRGCNHGLCHSAHDFDDHARAKKGQPRSH